MNPVGYLETGVLYCDDNLQRLAQFPAECIDLIYLDPPFFSNRTYEVIWGDEAEVRSFEDRWEGGINVYVNWMRDRVMEMHRVLKPTGSIYLHCDQHASHYLKVMMDEVFGINRFRNEIVWSYKRYTAASNRFQRLHDTLLFYSKGDKPTFNVIRDEYGSKSGKADSHYKLDEEGRWFRWQKRKGQEPYKVYLSEGRRVGDVWEIPHINASAKERLGYPTQKPEKLLQQVIEASSNPGDIVLDPFAGCGTAIAVAEMLRRNWIGIDISPTAVGLMKARMQKMGGTAIPIEVKLVGMPVSVAQLKELKPFEFQNWVIQQMHGTHSPRKVGDMGIDGYSYIEHLPIQVKQSEKVGRNTVDNFETAIDRAGKKAGYIVAFSFTRNAREEVARVKAARDLDIKLVEVAALLGDGADIVTPYSETLMPELPMPPARPRDSRPSPEELLESDQSENGGGEEGDEG